MHPNPYRGTLPIRNSAPQTPNPKQDSLTLSLTHTLTLSLTLSHSPTGAGAEGASLGRGLFETVEVYSNPAHPCKFARNRAGLPSVQNSLMTNQNVHHDPSQALGPEAQRSAPPPRRMQLTNLGTFCTRKRTRPLRLVPEKSRINQLPQTLGPEAQRSAPELFTLLRTIS